MIGFEVLFARDGWEPLRNCPGRYRLIGGATVTPEALVCVPARPPAMRVPGARDPVIVIALDGGGLISYARPDGTFVHTLNTPEGFRRKLLALGIDPATAASTRPSPPEGK